MKSIVKNEDVSSAAQDREKSVIWFKKKKKAERWDALGCFGYVPKCFLYDFSSGPNININ